MTNSPTLRDLVDEIEAVRRAMLAAADRIQIVQSHMIERVYTAPASTPFPVPIDDAPREPIPGMCMDCESWRLVPKDDARFIPRDGVKRWRCAKDEPGFHPGYSSHACVENVRRGCWRSVEAAINATPRPFGVVIPAEGLSKMSKEEYEAFMSDVRNPECTCRRCGFLYRANDGVSGFCPGCANE